MIRAWGHRLASTSVSVPGPQPRSTTISGATAPTLEVRSAKGRCRWSPNFSYWSGFQVSAMVGNLSMYLDIKILKGRLSSMPAAPTDDVDRIVDAWRRERPDLDVAPLHILSRVSRLARHLDLDRGSAFAEHGLEGWEFDVLSALRRAGEPYELSPGQLVAQTLVTSGTMTNRVDRLAARGLVGRGPDPSDRRGVKVTLTEAGRTVVDGAMTDLLDRERALLRQLQPGEQAQLAELLRRL